MHLCQRKSNLRPRPTIDWKTEGRRRTWQQNNSAIPIYRPHFISVGSDSHGGDERERYFLPRTGIEFALPGGFDVLLGGDVICRGTFELSFDGHAMLCL